MRIGFAGKTALVTGGSSGIGLACAEMLAAAGARVAIAALADKLFMAVERIREQGFVQGYELDVTSVKSIAPIITQIREEIGEIDILVCSAGTNIPQLAHEVTEEAWDAIHSVNLKGLFFTNQQVAIQSMIPRRTGSIVNISSVMGLVGGPKRAHYCSSKGGVTLLTKQEAIEWAPYNIRVNAVAPAFVLTEMTKGYLANPDFKTFVQERIPLHQQMVTTEEVAAAVCFLANDVAGMITGVTLPVDGGWTAQ